MAELEQEPVTQEVIVVEVAQPTVLPPDRPRKVYGGMWGPFEIAAVAIGVLVLVGVVALYLFMVVPSNRTLAFNKAEADRLDGELNSAKSKYGDITNTQTQVDKLVASVDDFETRFLPISSVGQAALYQRLNGLIGAYGLVNTTGPDYAPLETAEQNNGQQTDEERGRAKFRSLYPGVYVTTTVEGSYQNLRRFIREIETGREFVVISAVELAPSDTQSDKPETGPKQVQTGNPAGAMPPTVNDPGRFMRPPANTPVNQPGTTVARPKGKTHGETVSLHLEMAAYFRRPNFSPITTPVQ